MNIAIISIAKSVFQMHDTDRHGKAILKNNLLVTSFCLSSPKPYPISLAWKPVVAQTTGQERGSIGARRTIHLHKQAECKATILIYLAPYLSVAFP